MYFIQYITIMNITVQSHDVRRVTSFCMRNYNLETVMDIYPSTIYSLNLDYTKNYNLDTVMDIYSLNLELL